MRSKIGKTESLNRYRSVQKLLKASEFFISFLLSSMKFYLFYENLLINNKIIKRLVLKQPSANLIYPFSM
jgi:hypothetical protein